ncbi:MAG: 23S rRNA (adenine(2503)-C(2))-methyltransferase RlmN [Calditrichaceae bacterium]|nr:23S rRNA (adenine(2503)-C(2))-methyltransferase RlmN [Calditrichaceae bacterium]MBN2708061.1 23S rRNA (adenine(2503)-C(2))-methyltransferase RlmN [Calditrichaceae bacterium]RQV92302.1 MAG: 23S rRNA (adenine(2503)-C(2))-methyltransferase RlmN [Calditrichota bacterium]
MPDNILTYNETALASYFDALGQPLFRVRQVLKGLYSKEWDDFNMFSDLPATLRKRLETDFYLRSFKLVETFVSPEDETTKFLWELSDGYRIESVIIYEPTRVTFCISSQVGCPLDCKFCATGKMGLLRDLSAAEIVEQVLQMKKLSKRPPTNIVFMGMGEPFLNYNQVMTAAERLSDPEGMCFSRKKITISTSGIIKNIYRMADENRPFSLAVSLNAANQKVREQIMPVAKKNKLNDIIKAVKYYSDKTKKWVTFEYVLIKNINSSINDALELVKLTHGIPCKINVIPCNSDDPAYQPPDDETIAQFDRLVNKKNKTITIRNRKGWDIKAACGQLYAANKRKNVSKNNKKDLNAEKRLTG